MYRLLEVKEFCPAIVIVPAAFSPNGDGLNDELHLLGKRYMKLEFRIYNRWGEQLFSTTAPDEQSPVSWDGMVNGQPVPGGVYAYTIAYFDINNPGRPLHKSGTVTIIR